METHIHIRPRKRPLTVVVKDDDGYKTEWERRPKGLALIKRSHRGRSCVLPYTVFIGHRAEAERAARGRQDRPRHTGSTWAKGHAEAARRFALRHPDN